MGANPHVFSGGGHNIKINVPPPPTFLGVGWILVDIMYFFAFFLLVRNVRDVGWVPLHILTCATFDADGAPEKKCRKMHVKKVSEKMSESPPPPPPAPQLFWDLRYLRGWRRSGKMCLSPPPPPQSASDLRPCHFVSEWLKNNAQIAQESIKYEYLESWGPLKRAWTPTSGFGDACRVHAPYIRAPVFDTLNSAISNLQRWFDRTVMEVLKYWWM